MPVSDPRLFMKLGRRSNLGRRTEPKTKTKRSHDHLHGVQRRLVSQPKQHPVLHSKFVPVEDNKLR